MAARALEVIKGLEVEFIAPGHSRIKGTAFEVVARHCDPRWDLIDTSTGAKLCVGYGKRNTVSRWADLLSAMQAGEESINDTRD